MSKRSIRRRRIREGNPVVKKWFDVRVNTAPQLSDKQLSVLNDEHPGDVFNWARWSAKSVSGVTEIRSLVNHVHRSRGRHPHRTVMPCRYSPLTALGSQTG